MFMLNILIWVAGWFVYLVAKKIRARQGVDLVSTYVNCPRSSTPSRAPTSLITSGQCPHFLDRRHSSFVSANFASGMPGM
jgi:hypothetical protein